MALVYRSQVPVTVSLELTAACNLSCSACPAAPFTGEQLSTVEWLDAVGRLVDLKVYDLRINGGEPLLHPGFSEIITRIRRARAQSITVVTNATLIDRSMAAQLERLAIQKVCVPLDGLEETHDRIRGRGSYRAALEGIRRLLECGIHPVVSFLPAPSNHRDTGPLMDALEEAGVLRVHVRTPLPEGRCRPTWAEPPLRFPDQVGEVVRVISEKQRQYSGMRISSEVGFYLRLPVSYGDCLRFDPDSPAFRKHLKDGCSAASRSCAVLANGDVVPCTGLLDFRGGNLRHGDLLEIWQNSENFRIIRSLHEVPMVEVPGCGTCAYKVLCHAGCRAVAYKATKKLVSPDPWCPYSPAPPGEAATGIPSHG